MKCYFLLKNYKNVFTSKKKKKTRYNSSKTHDSDIEPFQAGHGGDEEEEEEDENDYSVHNNWAIQLFLVAEERGVSDVAGWLDLTSTFGKAVPWSRGVVVVVAAVTGFYG